MARSREGRKSSACKWFHRINFLRRGDQKAAVGKFEIQQSQSHRVNVRAVGFNGYTPRCAAHPSEQLSKSLRRSVIADRRLVQGGGASNPRLTCGKPVNLACALVRAKEEQLISLDWPADSKAKLVLFEVRPWLAGLVQKEIIRIEGIVAQEFKNRRMIVVRAPLCDHADIGPSTASECCIVKSGLDLKFLQGVGIGNRNSSTDRTRTLHIADTDAVQLPVVVIGSRSVHINPVVGLSEL